MKYKELKKLLKKTQMELFRCQGRLNIANKTVNDLMMLNTQTEKHLQMTEKALEKEWIIVSYLEDRQVKLIQAMAE